MNRRATSCKKIRCRGGGDCINKGWRSLHLRKGRNTIRGKSRRRGLPKSKESGAEGDKLGLEREPTELSKRGRGAIGIQRKAANSVKEVVKHTNSSLEKKRGK